jgi:hypothetical protein
MPVANFSIIPSPKIFELSTGARLQSRQKNPTLRLIFDKSTLQIEGNLQIIQDELSDIFGGKIVETTNISTDFVVSLAIEGTLPHASAEAYRIVIADTIQISANAYPGLLYAVATLRQLVARNQAGQIEFPHCEIYDYPDIEFRCAARWLVELEGTRMMYDWGDGREKMLERYRRKIDFCMRHKINMAFFDGFEWKTDKYPQYVDDIRALNNYAAARNVRLEFGGHGIGFGGFPGHTLEGIKGLGDYNRHSYPDGEIYDCGRITGERFNPHFPSVTSNAMRNGTCRSNDGLNELKKAELENYVRQLEPGVLYIHNEDISQYAELEQMWLNRCPGCRARWPEDVMDSPKGAAGAIAYGMQCLYEGIASVKNPNSGYDGERDCQVIFASPAYGTFSEDDQTWQKISDFWVAVSKELGHSQIMFCVREQFYQINNDTLRIKQLSERLQREGGGHGLFVFVVSGADLYTNSALFAATPRLNHFFDGARAIFNFNGGLFAAPQEIYNSEYSWNLHSQFGIDTAIDYDEAKEKYLSRSVNLEYPESDLLLKRACELCYGDAATQMMQFYLCRDEENNFPAALFFQLFRRLFQKEFAQHNRAQQELKWQGIYQQTTQAMTYIDAALKHTLPRPEVREELLYLRGCLIFGKAITHVVAEIFAATPDWTKIENDLSELRRLAATYPQDFTSSHESEMNLWNGYIEKLSSFIDPIISNQ